MAIEAPKLTLAQQYKLVDALLVYHLADDSPQPTVALPELPTQLDTPELPRYVFIPPGDGKLLTAWPKKLPQDTEDLSALVYFVLSAWRQEYASRNNGGYEPGPYTAHTVTDYTKGSTRLPGVDARDINDLAESAGVTLGNSGHPRAFMEVDVVALLIAGSYFKKPRCKHKVFCETIQKARSFCTAAGACLDDQANQATRGGTSSQTLTRHRN